MRAVFRQNEVCRHRRTCSEHLPNRPKLGQLLRSPTGPSKKAEAVPRVVLVSRLLRSVVPPIASARPWSNPVCHILQTAMGDGMVGRMTSGQRTVLVDPRSHGHFQQPSRGPSCWVRCVPCALVCVWVVAIFAQVCPQTRLAVPGPLLQGSRRLSVLGGIPSGPVRVIPPVSHLRRLAQFALGKRHWEMRLQAAPVGAAKHGGTPVFVRPGGGAPVGGAKQSGVDGGCQFGAGGRLAGRGCGCQFLQLDWARSCPGPPKDEHAEQAQARLGDL